MRTLSSINLDLVYKHCFYFYSLYHEIIPTLKYDL